MLNLLPSQDKELLKLEQTRARVIILGNVIILTLLVLALILFSIKIDLVSRLEAARVVLAQKEAEHPEVGLQETEIKKLNTLFWQLNQFYNERKLLLPLLAEFSQTLPGGIQLTNLTYQKHSGEITLAGLADNRESLSEFKAKLESNPVFSQIYFPAGIWVKAQEIDFAVTLKVFSP